MEKRNAKIKNTKLKGIKIRLYPNKKQEKQFKQEVGNQRFIWNYFLDLSKTKYEILKENMYYSEMANMLPFLKDEIDFLKIGVAQSLQQTLKDLEQSFKNFYRNVKNGTVSRIIAKKLSKGKQINNIPCLPKFKKQGQDDSYRIPQRFYLKGNKIQIPKVGKIRFRGLNKLKTNQVIKNVTISCENGKWYCSLCVEFKPKKFKKTHKSIGLDVGSVRLYTRSDGKKRKPIRNLDNVKAILFKIKSIQQQMSWKQECWKQRTGHSKLKKGEIVSNAWLKLKIILSKLHEKLKRIKVDYLHKITTNLVKRFDLIVVEDLKLSNMTRSSKGTLLKPGKMVPQKSGLNRNLLSNSLGLLFQMLEYKCNWYGKTFKKVDPKFTSQTCSKCGTKNKKSRESQSRFRCKSCGFKINADHNAAINILAKAV